MKKKLAIALIGAAALASLAGCGNVDDGLVKDTPGDNAPLPTAITGTNSPTQTTGTPATTAPSMSAME